MNKQIRLFSFFAIIVILLGACNLPSSSDAQGEELELTLAAQTVEALLSQTPLATNTTLPSAATTTPTLLPVNTSTSVSSATPTCNLAQFVADVNIPDGTEMNPGQTFTKKWRIKNIGACAWNGYSMIFDSGDQMGGPATKAIAALNPGQEVDLEVDLTAPNSGGSYRGYWRISTNSNVLVPVVNGYQGKSFYVDIKVKSVTPTPTNTATNAQIVLNPVGSESGTLYEPADGVPSTILAGDTSTNSTARGFMSFDISTLSGKTIQNALLSLSSCSTAQNPFSNLLGIWVGEVQYTLPLDQVDYNIGGTGIINMGSVPAAPIDVKTFVQNRATEGKARFQIRLHPAKNSNNDNQADYFTCNAGSVTLTISYNP